MTRLTAHDLKDLIWRMESRDEELKQSTGHSLKQIATHATAGRPDAPWRRRKVGIVAITSGNGAIPHFTAALQAIVEHLGQEATRTTGTDLAGIAECAAGGCEIILMADDRDFVAIDLRRGRVAHNATCTGSAYAAALHLAAGVRGRRVTIVGAGPVGIAAAAHLLGLGASVTMVDRDGRRLREAAHLGVEVVEELDRALKGSHLVLNASPAEIKGEWLEEGCVISSPGVPCRYDAEARRKARAIIHDPLQLGTAAMLASLCLKNHDESVVLTRTEV
jgi:pyrrolysine biosynthesis protein PylD